MTMKVANARIRPAHSHEAEILTALCLRSKAYWPYDRSYLEASIPYLTITEGYIRSHPVLVCEQNNKILGFVSLISNTGVNWLDNLWVEPVDIGTGVGRLLYKKALDEAHLKSWLPLRIAADPGAEGFYLKMGAKRIGELESRVRPGLMFPLLEEQGLSID